MKVMVFDVGGTEIKYSVMDDTMNYYAVSYTHLTLPTIYSV